MNIVVRYFIILLGYVVSLLSINLEFDWLGFILTCSFSVMLFISIKEIIKLGELKDVLLPLDNTDKVSIIDCIFLILFYILLILLILLSILL